MKYPHFIAALRDLAPTGREIAEKLGCSRRMAVYYLAERYLPPVEKVKLYPSLDHALTRDIRPEEFDVLVETAS